MPPVTVIINLYNGEATLAEAIDSVVAQTFADWELLVWDDCSTDGGADNCATVYDARIRYVGSDTRFLLGRHDRRRSMLAQGEWIAFLDQDDLWLPDKLERQLALAREKPDAALIYGRTVRFYPNGSERDYDQAHEYALLPEGDIFPSLFTDSCYIAMSSAMFRRAAVEAIGGIPADDQPSSLTTTSTPQSPGASLPLPCRKWCAATACMAAVLRRAMRSRCKKKRCG